MVEQATLEEAPASAEVEETPQEGEALTQELATEAASEAPAEDTAAAPEPVDLETLRKEIEETVRAEYEGPGGKIAKVQSARDKEFATLQKQLASQRKAKMDQADSIMQADPARAAQLHKEVAIESQQAQEQELVFQEWGRIAGQALEGSGVDITSAEGQERLVADTRQLYEASMNQDPNMLALQYQQQVATEGYTRRDEETAKERKEKEKLAEQMEALEASIPDQIDKMLTRKLAVAGYVPEPGDGTDPPEKPPEKEDYRLLSADELKRRGRVLDAEKIKAQLVQYQ